MRNAKQEARRYQQLVDRIDTDMKRLAELHGQLVKLTWIADECYEAGILSPRQGHTEKGERWLLAAVMENPDHTSAHAALADFHGRRSEDPRAAYHRQQAQRRKASE